MTEDLFLIAGGGTGAKAAEAFVHLCASGLGPARAHILFVDADTTNGNLQRALDTARTYQQLQKWPWAVQTTLGGFLGFGGKRAELDLFRTELAVTAITEPIETTHEGGLAASATPEMRRVLDLLYDADEQEAKCDDGFRARPNLGCLLLADHLGQRLPREGKPFLDALQRAAQAGRPVPVVVAASVFGGTGASLLPIARGVIETALRRPEARPATEALRWAAVMLLPHYQPRRRVESVDPDRYLLDTASALQFYGTALRAQESAFHAVYAIGSDRPSRNLVEAKLGKAAQANPAYVEEVVAALAALDFGRQPDAAQRTVRVFQPDRGADALGWADLPLGNDGELQRRFAYLLHLAAFYLRPGDRHQELTQGLAALMRRSTDERLFAHAWYKNVLDPWARALSPTYVQTPEARRPSTLKDNGVLDVHAADALRPAAVEYFGRLLLWASTALRTAEAGAGPEDLHLLDYQNEDYARLYGAMARLQATDVEKVGERVVLPADDNALVRLLRTALVALVSEHERTGRGGISGGASVPLVQSDGRIGLRIAPADVHAAFQEERLSDVADEYTRTAVRASA